MRTSNPIPLLLGALTLACAVGASLPLAGCSSGAAHLYRARPELAPGRTTPEAFARAERSPAQDEAGTAEEGQGATARGERLTSWAAVVRRLLERNPAIAASGAALDAARARSRAAGTPPPPRLTYTYLPEPVETRVGPNEHRIQLVQAVPFPTKLVARSDAAGAAERAAEAVHERTVRDQLTLLSERWAELYYYARALEVVTANEALARTLSQLAGERYGADRGFLGDVSRAQSQLAQLGYDRLRLEELQQVSHAELNAVLARPADAPLPVPATLPRLEVALTEDELVALALTRQQELRALDEHIRAAEARLTEARSQWAPDLSLGLLYLVNGPARMPGVADSGRDAVGVTVGLTLPLWFWENAARVDEAEAAVTAAVLAKQGHLDGLRARVRRAATAERNARRLRVLYDDELLPQATAAMASAERWYRAEPARFSDFLEARATWYSFSLARERAVADHFQSIARLEQVIGATLSPARAEGGPR